MVCVQEIKRENRLRTEHRRRVPTDAQELPKIFKKAVFGTLAEADADSVMAGKINNKYPLSLGGRGAETPRVPEIHDQAEALECYALEKAVRPDLRIKYVIHV